MKRLYITIVLLFLTLASLCGQSKKTFCDCPKTQFAGTKADTAFHFPNGKTIVFCGYKNLETRPPTFSEFILAECGKSEIIDFWGALLNCRLKVEKETLLVEELQNLPTGNNFNYQETVWTTEKIYFSKEKIVRKLEVNRKIKKYSPNEIKAVLREYEITNPGLDDSKMVLANKLFIGAISGDKKARHYFEEFDTKFGLLDGAYKEEYKDLTAMLKLWDAKQ